MPRHSTAHRGSRGSRSEAPLFAALGDPVRLSLVKKLSAMSPQSITELCEGASITRQGITKHLHTLERTGIVYSVRRGRESLYAFAPERMRDIRRFLDRVAMQWDRALHRLKKYVEE